jgi:hypothetical protein
MSAASRDRDAGAGAGEADAGRASGLSPEEKAIVSRLAAGVARRGMAVPAILALEMHRPLSWVASQAMHMLAPIVTMILPAREWRIVARMLERREAIEDVIVAIEEAEAHAPRSGAPARPR